MGIDFTAHFCDIVPFLYAFYKSNIDIAKRCAL